MTVIFMSSLTRISDLDTEPFQVRELPRKDWGLGDYVLGEITGVRNELYRVELTSGRMVETMPGDHVIGAFGRRAATLEGVGDWAAIEGGRMHALTSAGLFGRSTSMSPLLPSCMRLQYRGHIVRGDDKVTMGEFAVLRDPVKLRTPTVLLVGTSMSAGKTTAGKIIIHELTNLGKTVVGTKLTGAGRFRDILSFRDAGADAVFDFTDAGLPSTVVPPDEFRKCLRPLLSRVAAYAPDVLVAEAGASPLEPYNGAVAIKELGDNIRCTILCASDPYAVVGVQDAFGLTPDLVAGPAASTSAAVELVRKLGNLPALNLLQPDSLPGLRRVLTRTLGVEFPE